MSKLIEKLDAVYRYAWKNPYSNLYRRIHPEQYGHIDSLETWHKLPFLTKDHLLETPLKERVFLPYEQVDYFRFTSGTSGRRPLISPRVNENPPEMDFPDGLQITGTLAYLFPTARSVARLRRAAIQAPVIPVDPSDLPGTARLAAQAGLNHILSFTHFVKLLHPFLEAEGVADQIKLMDLFGETFTTSTFAELQTMYPNAIIRDAYAATEFPYQPGAQNNPDLGPAEIYRN